MNIYVSGSMAYDRIMDFPGRFADHIMPDKIHILNVCFTVNGMTEKLGGTAGNIAYTLALLGEKPTLVATIGKDYATYFERLNDNGIATDSLTIVQDEFTAGAYITTDKADNQITGFNPGAMKRPARYDFSGADAANSIGIIAAGNLEDMAELAATYRHKRIPFICDPGQSLTAWTGDSLREWIDGCAILITNDYEFELVMKMTGLKREDLFSLAETVIITLGEKGSLIVTSDAEVPVPAAPVADVLDPTGAGDAYRAGLLKGMLMGRPLAVAGRMGAVASAYAIEQYGTQEHRFAWDDFSARYRAAFGSSL
ncbi:MAG: adenosine kinase [Nitrospirae bacterium]|nr:MAG: adenosine kinase [Nitrospirota bacterium]